MSNLEALVIANIINHIVLVLDASGSMQTVSKELVKVADSQIAYLAQRSKEMDQETRITVYSFSADMRNRPNIRCLVYDKDVLRMPSIAGIYRPDGMTPLIDATMLALSDLALTPEKYGEHSFLVYVLTDGQENASTTRPQALADRINGLPDNWTVAAFVPDQTGVFEAKKFGFPKNNISVWNAASGAGIQEVGEVIRRTTEQFMQGRSQGVRGSRNLFSLETPSVAQVATTLQGLHAGQYRLLDVDVTSRIDELVERKLHRPYRRGEAYYQLTKTETIQPQKEVAILAKHVVYTGRQARQLLGLPAFEVKVQAANFPDYEIFVQSTSNNRKLLAGTKLLILS